MSATADLPYDEAMIDGLRVRTFGDEGARPILFSSGLGGSGTYWQPQLAAFARDHRVVTYDHRGTGKSDRSGLALDYGVAHLAADMALIIEGLGLEQPHVVGHAAGAAAGLELARTRPDLLRTLTVINGWVRPGRHFRRCMEIRRDIYRSGGAWAYLRAQPLFLYPPRWIEDHLDHLDAETETHAETFQAESTLFARMQALELSDFSADVARIRTPTLVVAVDDDALVPVTAGIDLANRLPQAKLLRLPWGGHAVNVTDVETFNTALRSFLIQHS